MSNLDSLIADVSYALHRSSRTLITAESCTGGLIASYLTGVPGSSEWFEGAFVTYRLSAKIEMLGVSQASLDKYSAVSETIAKEMATGALTHSAADISVSVTGVAGPGGGDVITPVGTVWFGWAARDNDQIVCIQTSQHEIDGNRQQIRNLAVEIALDGVLMALS